ncbi:MAG: hypothetical protein RL238_2737 [Actinomycetota bacterium]
MSMDPPKVLLEATFLDAVANADHPRHDDCVAAYRELVQQYELEQVLLVAVSDHLRDLDHPQGLDTLGKVKWFVHRPSVGMFAPVDPLYVGGQHRRAAAATKVDDPSVALTLVMCSRYGVRRVATLHEAYEAFDLDLLPLPVA